MLTHKRLVTLCVRRRVDCRIAKLAFALGLSRRGHSTQRHFAEACLDTVINRKVDGPSREVAEDGRP